MNCTKTEQRGLYCYDRKTPQSLENTESTSLKYIRKVDSFV